MSESQQENPVEETEAPQEGEKVSKTYDEDYVKNLRAEAAKYRTQAKAATTEAEKARNASLSEAERAIAEARVAGRTEAVTEFGKRLARTEFDALAARRNPDYDTESALEYVDLARFLGEDGEPDTKAITAAVLRLVPEPSGTPAVPASLDLGTRGAAPMALNGDPLERALRNKLGIA